MTTNASSRLTSFTPDEQAEPIPKRFWWLKRIGIGVVLLLAALLVLRLWWGAVAHRRLTAAIESLRASGEPIDPEDFDPPEAVDDAVNAALVLRQAANAIGPITGKPTLIDDVLKRPDICLERLDEVNALLQGQQPALDLLRRARSLPFADWHLRMRSPVFGTVPPGSPVQPLLVKLACVAALSEHVGGNDREAVEMVRDTLALARATDQCPTLIAHLVGVSMSSRTCTVIQFVVPDLAVGSADGTGDQQPAATRAQVRALITELLEESGLQTSIVRAFQFERMAQHDVVRQLLNGKTSVMTLGTTGVGAGTGIGAALSWPIRPAVALDAAHMLTWGTHWVEAARQPDWPAASRTRLPDRIGGPWQGDFAHLLSRILLPSLDRVAHLHYRALADRRMAAVALAIRVYELDHGQRPGELGDLVPGYLHEVPADPFAADGRTIAYRPQADPPLLYSVSLNGLDDGGRCEAPVDSLNWEIYDLPFFLNGRPPDETPGPTPSAKTRNDQAEVEG